MDQLVIVLLLILGVLLIGDLIFLSRILKGIKKVKKTEYDEKYFELKYQINLLKSISAILLLVLGFLGYSNFQELKTKMEEDINKSIALQRNEIERMDSVLNAYKSAFDTLQIYRNNLDKLINQNETDLRKINNKVNETNNTFKYNPRVYIVDNLVYPGGINNHLDSVRFYFKDMETIHGEKLPKFEKIPFVVPQGHKIGIDLLEVTKNSILVGSGLFYGDGDDFKFNLWIGSSEK
jgi:hypothetical protein